jgi:alcohol dehydrogenase (cytochrome c)
MFRIQGSAAARRRRPTIKSTPFVNGILYFTIPDHVFAVNARTGERIWQCDFVDQAGPSSVSAASACIATGCLRARTAGSFPNAKDGRALAQEIADEKLQYSRRWLHSW